MTTTPSMSSSLTLESSTVLCRSGGNYLPKQCDWSSELTRSPALQISFIQRSLGLNLESLEFKHNFIRFSSELRRLHSSGSFHSCFFSHTSWRSWRPTFLTTVVYLRLWGPKLRAGGQFELGVDIAFIRLKKETQPVWSTGEGSEFPENLLLNSSWRNDSDLIRLWKWSVSVSSWETHWITASLGFSSVYNVVQ